MGVWIVDPDWYFSTAATVGSAAEDVATQMGIAENVLSFQTQTMAGDDPIGTAWGKKYDAAALEMLYGVRLLCTAWSGLAMRLYEAGENHAWAEFEAGRRIIPGPQNLPQKPPVREPAIGTPPSSVGNNGSGLDEVLPGLKSLVGRDVPNGDTEELGEAATALAELSQMIITTCQSVIHQVGRPPADLPDASAFYTSIMSITAPADAAAVDALTLAAHCETFSTALTTMRENIQTQIDITSAQISAYVTAGIIIIIATRMAGTKYVIKELTPEVIEAIEDCADMINVYIDQFETAVAGMGTYAATLDSALKAILFKFVLVAADGNERLSDGSLVPTTRYFTPAKAAAWERYLERDGEWDIDRWSQAYDQLAANAATGYQFDQYAARAMGYDSDDRWERGYRDPSIMGGRVWDYANVWTDGEGNQTGILVENKSGAIDWGQFDIDMEAMSNGYQVVWNINANYDYSEADLNYLRQMAENSNGRFVLNEI